MISAGIMLLLIHPDIPVVRREPITAANTPISLRISLRAVDTVSRKPLRNWSEWQDLNLRPPRPERGALSECAYTRLPRRVCG